MTVVGPSAHCYPPGPPRPCSVAFAIPGVSLAFFLLGIFCFHFGLGQNETGLENIRYPAFEEAHKAYGQCFPRIYTYTATGGRGQLATAFLDFYFILFIIYSCRWNARRRFYHQGKVGLGTVGAGELGKRRIMERGDTRAGAARLFFRAAGLRGSIPYHTAGSTGWYVGGCGVGNGLTILRYCLLRVSECTGD